MRIIKYKFWFRDKKKMVDWGTAKKKYDRLSLFESKNIVSLQFTGKLDKNGKEIYEGDFVKQEKKQEHKLVFYKNCSFGIMKEVQGQTSGSWFCPLWQYDDLEIIEKHFLY